VKKIKENTKMERKDYLERRDERAAQRRDGNSSSIGVSGIVGGLLLLGVAALVIVTLPDIKRYVKISTM